MVHLQRFHEQYADKGLLVFIISMHANPEKARKLSDDMKVTYPIFNGTGSDLGKHYAYG